MVYNVVGLAIVRSGSNGEKILLRNIINNRILLIITSVLSLTASLAGIFYSQMYDPVVPARIMPGVFTQDLITILVSMILLVLAVRLRPNEYQKGIVMVGILGFLFYAYGIYAIEQIYTPLYPLYLAILGLSFFGLIYTLTNLDVPALETLQLPKILRYGAAGYSILIAVNFNMIWFSQLIPLLQTGERIEYTFSVYIIDLVFIMPAFVISAVMAIRQRSLGIIGLPSLFIVGAGILSPLALGEVLKPFRYGTPTSTGDLILFGVLSAVFLILATVYLHTLRPGRSADL